MTERASFCARVMLGCVVALSSLACRSVDVVGNNCELSPGVPCDDPTLGGAGGGTADRNDTLDLLFVVDNTAGMTSTQAALSAALPEMMRALISGDVTNEGRRDFEPIKDLHYAVVSTDMGLPGVSGVSDCGLDTGRPLGDDGLFLSTSTATVVLGAPCVSPPSIVRYSVLDPSDSLEVMQHDAACLTLVQEGGCRHAMPAEAALKALWNTTGSDVTFLEGEGHGLTTQAEFLRDNALLAIIIVTARDDCSSQDLAHLLPDDQLPPDDLVRPLLSRDARCAFLADAHLRTTGYYKDAFGALKDGVLERLFVGVIAGVPSDLTTQLASAPTERVRAAIYDDVLEDPRMLVRLDPDSPPDDKTLLRSCGAAVPPRRLVELAQRLGDQAAVASICDDMSDSLSTLTRALARRIDPTTTL